MSGPEVEHVLTARARLGESPVWDAARRTLAWVDTYNRRVHQFDPVTGSDCYLETRDVVSAVAPVDHERVLVALSDELAFMNLRSGDLETLCRVRFPFAETRFNDGKCDARGRFWIGSISETPGQAALYRFDPDGTLHLMVSGLTISNGLGWSPDGKVFYLTDSPQRKIFAYPFDVESGALGEPRVLVELGDEAVEPDGLAIDLQGNLWSALWNGWCVVCFDTLGREIARTALPIQRPTSVTFGGPELADLYVTSASVGLSQSEIQRGVWAGDLFRIPTHSRGMPAHRFGSAS